MRLYGWMKSSQFSAEGRRDSNSFQKSSGNSAVAAVIVDSIRLMLLIPTMVELHRRSRVDQRIAAVLKSVPQRQQTSRIGDSYQGILRCRSVPIVGLFRARIREDSSAENGSINHCHSPRGCLFQQLSGTSINESPAVVNEQDFEHTKIKESCHRVHISSRQTNVTNLATVTRVDERFNCSPRSAQLVEVVKLWIVKMHNRQRRDTESFATLRKRATNSVTAEIIPVRINFCHNRDIRGYATIFGDRPPDAQFAATRGVAIRGVNCSDIAVKDSPHQIDRGLLCDRVAEVLRHAAQRCAAQGDGTHIQTGLPEGVHVP